MLLFFFFTRERFDKLSLSHRRKKLMIISLITKHNLSVLHCRKSFVLLCCKSFFLIYCKFFVFYAANFSFPFAANYSFSFAANYSFVGAFQMHLYVRFCPLVRPSVYLSNHKSVLLGWSLSSDERTNWAFFLKKRHS